MPIWLQIRGRILHLIASGKLSQGDQLPSMRQLAVELQVNMNTISKVYQDLQKDGFLISHRGKGLFVADVSQANSSIIEDDYRALTEEYVRRCLSSGMLKDEIIDLVRTTIDSISATE